MPVLDQTDLLKLSELIEKEEAEAARLRVDADKMRDAIRTADKWTPDDLNRLNEAYKPSDHKRDQIVQMRQQYNRLAGTPADGTQLPTNGSTATSPASQFSPFDPGERFTGSEPYRRFREVVKAGRKLDVAWLSELKDGVEVMNRKESKDSNFGVRQRAVTLTNLPWSERQPDLFVPLAARPVVLLDLISADLMGDSQRAVEYQIVNGTGTPWNGILNTSGINTQARGTDTWLDCIHKGITQI